MESKPQTHLNVNLLQKISTPTVIKTSKQWVLPPRPRPGRKPNANTSSQPKKEPKKTYKKKSQQQQQSLSPQPTIPHQALHALQMITPAPSTSSTTVSSPQTPMTPCSSTSDNALLELALKNMKDENQLLKQELSRLVADLKSLKAQQPASQTTALKQHVQEEELFHKKRNSTEDDMLSIFNIDSCEDDDNVSQISTPSLVSTSSSMSASMPSLDSIKEDQVLKIDEFLTTSLFEPTSNNSISTDSLMAMQPPSMAFLKSKINEEEFEFNFLKQENSSVFKNGATNLLLQTNEEMAVDTDFWEWK